MSNPPTELETFIRGGWTDHADKTAEVADRLEAGLGLVEDAGGGASFMSLVTHVVGDHLGDRARARRLCETVAESLGGSADTNVQVYLSAARRLDGDDKGAAQAQRRAGQDPALGVRIGMIVAQGLAHAAKWDEADTVYGSMLSASDTMEAGHSAERSVAVVSNNIASELLGVADRSGAASALMRAAARAAYTYWSRIGTWVNKERGEYLLSLVHREIGDSDSARKWAERGLETIREADGDELVDQAFLHVAHAAACRDAGDLEAQAESLAAASALAVNFEGAGLLAWFQKEHAKAL